MIKNNVATRYFVKRNVEETRAQLLDALYEFQYPLREPENVPMLGITIERKDAEGRLLGVAASRCRGMIRQSHEWIDKWINSHPGIVAGTVEGRLLWRERPVVYPNEAYHRAAIEHNAARRPVDDEIDAMMDQLDCAAYEDEEWHIASEHDWDAQELLALNLLSNDLDTHRPNAVNGEDDEEEDDSGPPPVRSLFSAEPVLYHCANPLTFNFHPQFHISTESGSSWSSASQ
jgi:hypothetical protein